MPDNFYRPQTMHHHQTVNNITLERQKSPPNQKIFDDKNASVELLHKQQTAFEKRMLPKIDQKKSASMVAKNNQINKRVLRPSTMSVQLNY